LLFATQDRYELARMSLTSAAEGIDPRDFDVTVLWLDGSETPASVDFFRHFESDRVTLEKEGGYRNLGAARSIQLGMNRLAARGGFDWIGNIESDCYFLQGWLEAAFGAARAAAADGVKVGAMAAESTRARRFHPDYALIEVLCASNALFLPEAWNLVPPASIAHNFPKRYFAGLCELPMTHPNPELGWDWLFAMALYHAGGYEVVTTPRAKVLNCGTADSHKRLIESVYVQEDFETPVLYQRPPKPERLEAEWHRAVRKCHARSDAAILQCADLADFRYLWVEFRRSWYEKESNEDAWWRWADGAADVLIHNSANHSLNARLEFGLSTPGGSPAAVTWNGVTLPDFGGCAAIEIPAGVSVLRIEPPGPGTVPAPDGRRLAVAVVKKLSAPG
jgi:hypothetical protein